MKVLVITGSPHKNGTSAMLAENFINGAREAGHEVCRFDAAFKKIHPCIACERCRETDKGCVFRDDMDELNPQLLAADVVVFASPIYYFAVSAQIKLVMDRFYANNAALHQNKKTVLLVTMADDTREAAEGAMVSFNEMTKYLEWETSGVIAAVACGNVEALKKTEYPRQAYELGKNLLAS